MQSPFSPWPSLFWKWLSLGGAIAGCFVVGWLLVLFQVPSLLMALVYCGLVYLLWQTLEALFLSQLGLMLLLFVAVARRPWPLPWQSFSAWNQPRLWAMTLLGLWFFLGALLVLLAQTSRQWQGRGQRRLGRYGLLLLCGSALGFGSFWGQQALAAWVDVHHFTGG